MRWYLRRQAAITVEQAHQRAWARRGRNLFYLQHAGSPGRSLGPVTGGTQQVEGSRRPPSRPAGTGGTQQRQAAGAQRARSRQR